MKKIYFAVILVVLAGGLLVWTRAHPKIMETPEEAKVEAWGVFQSYLEAAKQHDLKTLSNLTYELSRACKDPSGTKECNSRMDTAASLGTTMKKEDYTHILYDDKQIILFTDYKPRETENTKFLERGLIYFIRASGGYKILSFIPNASTFTPKKATSAETDARLAQMVKDTDNDTLDDEVEVCSYSGADPKTCVKTDPNSMDTDRNGLWDPIDALVKGLNSSK